MHSKNTFSELVASRAFILSTVFLASTNAFAGPQSSGGGSMPRVVASQQAIAAAVSADEVVDRIGLEGEIVSVDNRQGLIIITGSNGCQFNVEVHVARDRFDETKVLSVSQCL